MIERWVSLSSQFAVGVLWLLLGFIFLYGLIEAFSISRASGFSYIKRNKDMAVGSVIGLYYSSIFLFAGSVYFGSTQTIILNFLICAYLVTRIGAKIIARNDRHKPSRAVRVITEPLEKGEEKNERPSTPELHQASAFD